MQAYLGLGTRYNKTPQAGLGKSIHLFFCLKIKLKVLIAQ